MFFNDSPLRKKKVRKPVELTKARVQYSLKEFEVMSDDELRSRAGETFICDTECYPNFWLAMFTHVGTNKVVIFERSDWQDLDRKKLNYMMLCHRIVTFNGVTYDEPMVFAAVAGCTNDELKQINDNLINDNMKVSMVRDVWDIDMPDTNHIDLKEVAPLKGSLKAYAARLHAPSLQDLPYSVGESLTEYQAKVVTHYCFNDTLNTKILWLDLAPQIALREELNEKYKVDVRSKSDAQIAEVVIAKELQRISNRTFFRPTIEPGTKFSYNVPSFMGFQTPLMQHVLETVRNAEFIVKENGGFDVPKEIAELNIRIGNSAYKMGNGGLHSTEKEVGYKTTATHKLIDRDVASYYPAIILTQRLFPKHLGTAFLDVYAKIVEMRLAAKKAKNSVVADSLKIVINGSFGKLGSMYSLLYAPDLMIQVTISGQLCLLMLIEYLELNGIPVVSANTDGIVMNCPVEKENRLNEIVKQWEAITGFETEEMQYASLWSRDVNNYIAVKKKYDKDKEIWLDEIAGSKGKGAYSNHWTGRGGKDLNIFKFHKNPEVTICIEAAIAHITTGESVESFIRRCDDITKFVAVRYSKFGAAKDGQFLGKIVRWYYSTEEDGDVQVMANSSKLPKSQGARPLMEMDDKVPADIDYDWYINETVDILTDINYIKRPKNLTLW